MATETSLWTWIASIAGVTGIGGFIAWYVSDTLKALLRPWQLTPAQIVRRKRGRDVPSAPGTHFTVVVADLEDDDNNLSQTRHVQAAFRNQEGLDIMRLGPGPRPFETGSQAEHKIQAEKEGRARLARKNGDLLIWGEVAQANARLRLRFLPRREGIEGAHGSYQLEAAELPKDFGEDFSAQLIALALASLAPATEQQGRYLVDLLRQPAEKLERLLEKGAPGLAPDAIAGLQFALGNAAYTIGEQSNDAAWLWKAVAAYRVALAESPREQRPLAWARAQGSLGNALRSVGERETGTTRLEEAAAAHRAALEEMTRQSAPLDWAMMQNNLGTVLVRLGEREVGTARLDESVTAYYAALKEMTRDRVPRDWALIQNNLGWAFTRLGERTSGTALFDKAIKTFREALEEWTRERVPMLWAVAQHNLGTALLTLGERSSDKKTVEDAAAAFRAALQERTRDRVPIDWAATQNNFGNALRALGEQESDTSRLEEAVVVFRKALGERTRERVPLQWAASKNNLGLALTAIASSNLRLGKRESGKVRLNDAVAAYREALRERTRERVPFDCAVTLSLLGIALGMLGEQETGTEHLVVCP